MSFGSFTIRILIRILDGYMVDESSWREFVTVLVGFESWM